MNSQPMNHEVIVHETLDHTSNNISRDAHSLWEGFALQYDIAVQFCFIRYAEKFNCEAELLISCREGVNLSTSTAETFVALFLPFVYYTFTCIELSLCIAGNACFHILYD